jgi:hypothetical protein
MTDRKQDGSPREGSAEERGEVNDTSTRQPGKTKAGQEASQGKAPAQHDHEHQSNYGGGGVNGGA